MPLSACLAGKVGDEEYAVVYPPNGEFTLRDSDMEVFESNQRKFTQLAFLFSQVLFPSMAFLCMVSCIKRIFFSVETSSIQPCVLDFVDVSTVAPLCFLYNEPSKLYSVFREMYIRYFFRLHSISSSFSVRAFSG